MASDLNQCNKQPSLEVVSTSLGSPLSGPYTSGEEVEFCYTVTGFENVSCNYLQGVLPFFGPGWSEESFDADGSPKNITQPLTTQGRTSFTTSNPVCEGDPAGTWNWYEEGVISYNLNSTNPMAYRFGDDIGAGWVFLNSFDPTCFEFDDACCTNPTADPNQSYGDDNYPVCGGGLSHTWNVCFSLTTRITSESSPDNDCMVGFKTFADGELGAFRSNSCSSDRVIYVNAGIQYRSEPTSQSTSDLIQLELCPQETYSLELDIDESVTRVFWVDDQGELFVADPGTEAITLTAPLSGEKVYEVYLSNGRVSEPIIVEISVNPDLDAVVEQSPEQVCAGEPVTLTAMMSDGSSLSSTTISWSEGSDTESIALTDWIDAYTVDLNNAGCSTTLRHEINSFPQSQISLEGSDIICQGEEASLKLNLSGTAPWTVVLTDAAGEMQTMEVTEATYTESFTPDSDLVFTIVSATDGNGCEAEVDGQFEVLVSDDPQIQTESEITKFCNQNVELQATAVDPASDYRYEWINTTGDLVGQGQSIEVIDVGQYTLVTTDINTGCQLSRNVQVLESPDELQIDLVNDTNISLSQGATVQLEVLVNLQQDEIATVIWNGADGLDCTDCLTPTARPTTDAIYSVEVTDIYGCSARLSVNINVTDQSRSLYIPTAFIPGSAQESMFCVLDNGQSGAVVSMEIYDRWGSRVFSAQNADLSSTEACWDGTSNGQVLEQGVYVYKVSVQYPDEDDSLVSGTITLLR